jgi:hypothetical protein
MPFKDPEKRREYQRIYNKRWYQGSKENHLTNSAANRRRYRKQWLDFKATLSCTHCGAKHPAIIDFHHVIRDGTKQSVNRLAGDGRFKAAIEETKKCIPLCSNCHRVLHWDEAQEKKAKRNAKRKLKNKK